MSFWTRMLGDILVRPTHVPHRPTRRRERERYEVATLIRAAIEAARPQIEAAHHELLIELPVDPLWIDCDPNRIVHAITTLLNNAARYMPAHGLIEIIADQDEHLAAIRIRDGGLGVGEETLSALLTDSVRPERQLEVPRTLSVGLTQVKQMVEQQGGTLKARAHSRGSELAIHLPVDSRRGHRPLRITQQTGSAMRRALASFSQASSHERPTT